MILGAVAEADTATGTTLGAQPLTHPGPTIAPVFFFHRPSREYSGKYFPQPPFSTARVGCRQLTDP